MADSSFGGIRGDLEQKLTRFEALERALVDPAILADQAKLVRSLMNATGQVMSAADVARYFTGARAPQVGKILDTLVALGHARRTDSGYAPA